MRKLTTAGCESFWDNHAKDVKFCGFTISVFESKGEYLVCMNDNVWQSFTLKAAYPTIKGAVENAKEFISAGCPASTWENVA